MIRSIALATLVAGTLDILWAAVDATRKGGTAGDMLRSVASGPFPGASAWGAAGAVAGLAVHFAIMAVIATIFVLAYQRSLLVRAHPLLAGTVYGVAVWLIMYGLVLPLRFGAPFPDPAAGEVAKQLFAHVVMVGLAIALATRRTSPRLANASQ